MSRIGQIDSDLDAYLAPSKSGECSPEHDAWTKAQIKATLARKAAGEMTYHSLDDVMREFGFDARKFTSA